jgi:hypothetical protein
VNIQYQVVLHFSCLSFLDDLYKGISLTFKWNVFILTINGQIWNLTKFTSTNDFKLELSP